MEWLSTVREGAARATEPDLMLAHFCVEGEEREAHIVPAQWLHEIRTSGEPVLLADCKRYRIIRIDEANSAARVQLAAISAS